MLGPLPSLEHAMCLCLCSCSRWGVSPGVDSLGSRAVCPDLLCSVGLLLQKQRLLELEQT